MSMMIFSLPQMMLLLLQLLLLLPGVRSEFNDQVMGSVLERLASFMGEPVDACQRAANFREFGGFPNDMEAADRDSALTALYVELSRTKIYYGLENGVIVFFYTDGKNGFYREPGDDGYEVAETYPFVLQKDMLKHWSACVDPVTGDPTQCLLGEGAEYIQCWKDCEIDRCPDPKSQAGCSMFFLGEERRACEAEIKWCTQYTIETVQPGETRGFVPATSHCLNPSGQFEQEPGKVLVDADTGELGDCFYGDGKTPVERSLAGAYEYCGGNGTICEGTFTGVWNTVNYDPRYRGWYQKSKLEQKPVWTEPFAFYSLDIGITYTHPIYSHQDDKLVFRGVLAFDITLSVISDFLQKEYQGTDIQVFIIEDAEPYYMIGSSTGSKSAGAVLIDDPSQPCPDISSSNRDLCTPVRYTVNEIDQNPKDLILRRTFEAHAARGFPSEEFVTSKESDEVGAAAYMSQAQVYQQENANLNWRVIVTMPIDKADEDAALRGDSVFAIICFAGCLGFVLCSSLLVIFYKHRDDPAVKHADWRLTCGFLLGCSLLNLSTFTLLGPNTDESCMLRMWSFNFLFTCAVSPLFLKVCRMFIYHIGGEERANHLKSTIEKRRAKMTFVSTLLMTMPLLIVEIVLLLVFSILDPPEQRDSFNFEDDVILQHIYCDQDSRLFFWVQIAFHSLLVLVGCIVAFFARNMDPTYGEGKQASFCMYNIGFTSLIIVIILQVVNMNQNGKLILHAIGVLWGTLFSATAFVLPFLIAAMEDKEEEEDEFGRPSLAGQHHSSSGLISWALGKLFLRSGRQ